MQEVETNTAFELPDSLRRKDTNSDWCQNNQFGVRPDCFLGGSSLDRDGNLWVVNVPFGQILRTSPQGDWTVAAKAKAIRTV